jgi:hypothetical protein
MSSGTKAKQGFLVYPKSSKSEPFLDRRDVTMGEDACQVRMSGALQALAALNGGVLAVMDWLQVSNVASQMRHFCAHPGNALQLLCGKLLR